MPPAFGHRTIAVAIGLSKINSACRIISLGIILGLMGFDFRAPRIWPHAFRL